MVQLGKFNKLQIVRWAPQGAYLGVEGADLLLPKKYVPRHAQVGEWLDVFVYSDSQDRPVATTRKPKAQVDEFAALTVVATNEIGAFLDWGLEKDLLVPLTQQSRPMERGQAYVVRICLEEARDRLYATSKLAPFLEREQVDLAPRQIVDLLIVRRNELGYQAIVDGRYAGFIYAAALDEGETMRIGDRRKGYVAKVRDDGKVDISLTPMGLPALLEAKKVVLTALREGNGFLALGDHSDPEEIKAQLGLSKKAYKRAVGMLNKDGFIRLDDQGVHLTPRGKQGEKPLPRKPHRRDSAERKSKAGAPKRSAVAGSADERRTAKPGSPSGSGSRTKPASKRTDRDAPASRSGERAKPPSKRTDRDPAASRSGERAKPLSARKESDKASLKSRAEEKKKGAESRKPKKTKAAKPKAKQKRMAPDHPFAIFQDDGSRRPPKKKKPSGRTPQKKKS
ncbi:hypothetical protein SCOR_09030 [Sulfidibacter corallicola]|uniref:S1 motif domain-containing protein n=1 Tax=Sulfidibacter corallicola TaxID=2818388 RepID=A0A8A4TQ39_SULCO|nr:S1-like domain-containing RNA-binding protein [Sulfidibacter corallicola]QTD51098.1 hypothetical protein J3U87_01400 [Sulfidibacter corallicola]